MFDPFGRFYFGVNTQFYQVANNFSVENNANYKENHIVFSLGPYFSFDAYRLENFYIAFAGGVTLNFQSIKVTANLGNISDTRTFKGLSLTPRLGSHMGFKNYLPFADIILATYFADSVIASSAVDSALT